MSNDKYKMKKLDCEIIRIQLDMIDENKIKSDEKGKNKHTFLYSTIVLSICLTMAFRIPYIAFLIFIPTGWGMDVYLKKVDEFLRKKIPQKQIIDAEEFYYEEYRYAVALKKARTEEKRKYQNALERQNRNKEKEETIYYSKKDEINMMVKMIEGYFCCYKLPPLKIKPYEWDAFFDTLYDEFVSRMVRYDYFHAVSEIIRYTLAIALVNEANCIYIRDFVDSLRYLCGTKTNDGILPQEFNVQEVDDIQKRIMLRIDKKDVNVEKSNIIQLKKRT